MKSDQLYSPPPNVKEDQEGVRECQEHNAFKYEEINFRYVMINYLAPIARGGIAVILQALLYMVFYSTVLIASPGGYPGIFSEFFLIDMFSLGLIYVIIKKANKL